VSWRETPGRRAAWLGLIAAVVLVHGVLGLRVASSVIGLNTAPEAKRIEITFSKPLAPTAPTPVAAAAAVVAEAAPRPPRAVRRARAASAPASAPSEPATWPLAEDAAQASHRELEKEALALAAAASPPASDASGVPVAEALPAAASGSAGSAVPEPAASAATALAGGNVADAAPGPPRQAFAWPPSTRLTYTLTGLYRGGPIYGKAVIEWRRSGTHYQVQFDVHVSPFFDQHMFSDGQITANGLSPQRYDEKFQVPLLAPRVRVIEFTDNDVVLPNGNRVIRFPQTQDEASQFVQFVWAFATRPELTQPGTQIDFPLALASGVRRWTYRVDGAEVLQLPFGPIATVHLKPVREGPRRPNEYPFEFWTAPTLQYLPVRVLVPLDDKNFADLSLDALPLQAAPAQADDAASQPMLR
jgi:hypothetical protein